jgi:hypothetical protein
MAVCLLFDEILSCCNASWQGSRSTGRKPSLVALSTTDPTLPESNPDLSGGKRTTNRLSYDTKYGCNEYRNKPSGSIIRGEFVDPLRHNQHLMDSCP